MRNEFEALLKEELRILALTTREQRQLKQKNMAEALMMNDTSYSDIETGTYMCGTLTAFLLLMMQPDPNRVLRTLEKKFRAMYERAMQPV